MKNLADYNIEKCLSKTSNREVYLASNKKGQKVVIKKINRLGVSEALIENEIEAGRKLSHKRLVKFIGDFTEGSYTYLVIEYIKGLDLFALLSANNFDISLPEKEAKVIFRQLVEALLFTHKQGFVHHDVKLENVMVTEKSRKVKLIDYGLCEQMNPGDLSYSFCGSHDYVSPEVLKRTPYDGFKADVWSMGTVLYILLFAELPFGFQSRAEAIANGNEHPVVEFADHRNTEHTVSDAAKELISAMLESDPKKRISLEEVARHRWVQKEKTNWASSLLMKKKNEAPIPSVAQTTANFTEVQL